MNDKFYKRDSYQKLSPKRVIGLVAKKIPVFLFLIYTSSAEASATLTGLSFNDGGTGVSHISLTFSDVPPTYTIVGNDTGRPTLSLDGVTRDGTGLPSDTIGVLKTIEYNQEGGHLNVSFVGQGPIHISASPAKGRNITLSIAPIKSSSDDPPAGTGPAENGSLLPHSDAKAGEGAFEVVILNYADISEIVGLLSGGQAIRSNDNFTPQEPAFGASSFNGGSNGPNIAAQMSPSFNPTVSETAASAYGQAIDDTIGVDRRLNAIILRGSPERVALLKRRISELDVPVTSVLLETIFVELTETGAHNLGFDFNNPNGQVLTASYGRSLNTNIGASGSTPYGNFAFQAALFAQVQKGEGRVVSRPQISAQSGRTAKIITGEAIPILTSIALSGVNAVSQQVQYVNAGVTLQIAPRIGTDGYVTSHVFAEVSSVTGYSQGFPNISQREASTSITVKDGEYFIIGGLTQENRLKTNGKVPALGDLPLAGNLFRLRQENHSKTELYIVITPHIIRRDASEVARALATKMHQ